MKAIHIRSTKGVYPDLSGGNFSGGNFNGHFIVVMKPLDAHGRIALRHWCRDNSNHRFFVLGTSGVIFEDEDDATLCYLAFI